MSCCPSSGLDPFATASLAEPYPVYDSLRELGGAVRLEQHGVYALTRYEPVKRALRDWKTYSSARGTGIQDLSKERAWRKPSVLLEADPPLHDRTRGVLMSILSPEKLREMREMFRPQAAALVDELVERRQFDAVGDLAEAFPLRVIPDAIGLAPEGRENLLPFSNMQFNSFGPANEIFAQSVRDCDAVVGWIEAQLQRHKLAPGSIGHAVWSARDAGKLDDYEAATLVRAFLIAGLDTTINGMGAAILGLATHPEQWALLAGNGELVRNAFAEAIRWESPIQVFFRTTTTATEVEGGVIPAEAKVGLFLGAANRDPRRWPQPEKFDITRSLTGHVAFGHGIHTCIGQTIARMEAELLLEALSARVARITLVEEPTRRLNNTLRGLQTLRVQVTPL